MTILAFDNGNRITQLSSEKNTVTLPSQHQLNNQLYELQPDLVTIEINGKSYTVGNVFGSDIVQTIVVGKEETALIHFLALHNYLPQSPTKIDKLLIVETNPETSNYDSLLGHHDYHYLEGGVTYNAQVTVEKLEFVQEGLGAFRHFSKHGNQTQQITIVINIGAGTLDFLVYDRAGKLLQRKNLENSGAIAICNYFNKHQRQKGLAKFDLEPERIFSALENNDSKITKSFGSVFNAYLQHHISKQLTQFQQYKGHLNPIVVTGGLAGLVKGKNFYIPSQPNLVNAQYLIK